MGDMPTTSLDSEELPVVSVYSYIYIGLFLTHVFRSSISISISLELTNKNQLNAQSLICNNKGKKGEEKNGGGGISLYTVFSCSMNY